VEAEAEVGPPEVDVRMRAAMRLPGGARGEIACSLRPQDAAEMELRAEGTRGRLRAVNVVAPQIGHRLELEVDGVRRAETLEGEPTFVGQLRAFVRAVEEGAPIPTDAADAVRTLRVIDAVYRASGLRLRGGDEAP
jgi:predicted dehydrogenase